MISIYEFLAVFVILGVISCWVHIIRNWNDFMRKPKQTIVSSNAPHITFLVAGRSTSSLMQETIDHIHSVCNRVGYLNYNVQVVVDNADIDIHNAQTILVPSDFQSLSKYKARALDYSLKFTPNTKESWILHLDEDAKITPQGVLSMIDYIQKGGNPIANGPSLFLPHGRNRVISFLAEAQRHWTFYWLSSMCKGGMPCFLNGSNLLVRSDIEHQIGWSFKDCIFSEDTRFGYEAKKKLGSVFGWHGGLTFEQPPSTIKSIIKQRQRWFAGSIKYFKYVPPSPFVKARRIYSISSWLAGAILALLFIPRLFGFDPSVTPLLTIPLVITFGLWWARYYVGIYQNLKYASASFSDKIFYYISGLMIPLAEMVCGLGVFAALLRPPQKFEITGKVSYEV